MVQLLSAVAAISLTLAATVCAHSTQLLEKRAAHCAALTYNAIAPGQYPVLDCPPFDQDPQVQEWLKLVDMTKVPVYPPSIEGGCPPNNVGVHPDRCWWTCQKCTAPDDVVTCPKTNTWGLTYDDGPSPESIRLYDDLLQHNQKATLFVVGSRVVSYPETLKRAYKEGHHIAIHTWSHTYMTSLSNEQVVAELMWTRKAIFDTIGVTPLYWRPPFGDVDNRIRNIATQLGLKTSIWTQGFDTNDWTVVTGTPYQTIIDKFKTWLTKIPTMETGFIVLQHDVFRQQVDVALNGILPIAYATKGLTMQPIAQCLNDGKPYKEGSGTFQLGSGNNQSNDNNNNNNTNNTGRDGGKSAAVDNTPVTPLIVTGASMVFMIVAAHVL
ncbi:chitin deacetylase [Lunasporangiospora selenospora]|uniref:chitin deacetylase n=1 Tax=Lunasporangiospora selenospora TaxID=979761 RepID=A0A9P6G2T5_9FUNG|nr:chitin deacetylase [Lunasporangiospora selenospora]